MQPTPRGLCCSRRRPRLCTQSALSLTLPTKYAYALVNAGEPRPYRGPTAALLRVDKIWVLSYIGTSAWY